MLAAPVSASASVPECKLHQGKNQVLLITHLTSDTHQVLRGSLLAEWTEVGPLSPTGKFAE